MKRAIQKNSESEILKNYPIKGMFEGWYFRTNEISNNAWEVEGTDLWGCKVCCQGSDPQTLIIEAEAMAKDVAM